MRNILIDSIREVLQDHGEGLSYQTIEDIADTIEGLYENADLLTAPAENPLSSRMSNMQRKHEEDVAFVEECSQRRINNLERQVETLQIRLREEKRRTLE